MVNEYHENGVHLYNDRVENCYDKWESPIVIVSDGPYGVNGFPTDLNEEDGLAEWYESHISEWSERATSATTLWFWNTELGWANVHHVLADYGWEYRGANVWNKGVQHIAGNCNTETIRKFPQVTEVCVQYVRSDEAVLGLEDDERDVQQWMRDEWKRAGLSFQEANDACGVSSAATRKYFAADDMWYFPPAERFQKLRKYANEHGDEDGKPYLATEKLPYNPSRLHEMGSEIEHRAKFDCPHGVTNVWNEGQVSGCGRTEHPNQKPENLIERIIRTTSDEGDIIWSPFGGVFTTAIVCDEINRECYSAEIETDYYEKGLERVQTTVTI